MVARTHSGRVVVEPEPSDAVQLLQVDVALPPHAQAVHDQRGLQVDLRERKTRRDFSTYERNNFTRKKK